MPALPLGDLEAALDAIRAAPAERGTVALVVRRPKLEAREIVARAKLVPGAGLAGDDWANRAVKGLDGPNPLAEITVMGARAITAIAGGDEPGDWAPAGDQLFVDLDLSQANLPAGTRFAVGEAVLEVTEAPHLGCGKFSRRFGVDAVKFVNSEQGRELRLRGLNARIVSGGTVARGDACVRLQETTASPSNSLRALPS